MCSSPKHKLLFLRASVVNGCFGGDFITVEGDLPDLLFDTNSDGLLLRVGVSRVANDVIFEDQIVGMSPDADPRRFPADAVVLDDIFFQAIAVGRHAQSFVAEEHAILVVRANHVGAKKVVGIFVPYGDAESAIAFQNVVCEQAVPDPPAQEQTIGSVVTGDTISYARTLGAAARMDAKIVIILADTTDYDNIVGLLKADTIAIIIAHRAVFYDRPEGTI